MFGILGPNGAGKTTTLEMIETMRPIDGGSITICGLDVASQPQEVKAVIGVQPQTAAFQDKQKLHEIIEMFAAAYGEKVNPWEFWRTCSWVKKPVPTQSHSLGPTPTPQYCYSPGA